MMVFGGTQLVMMESRASYLLSKLKEWEKHDDKTKIGFIVSDFQEVCGLGYSIAKHEVCSTPWEYTSQPIHTDCALNDRYMNHMAEDGWEFYLASSGWQFWRRRKAVREIEKEVANHESRTVEPKSTV